MSDLRFVFSPLAVLLTMTALLAQQPNSPAASMTWNGVDGPGYPIVSVVDVTLSPALDLEIVGPPGQPYLLGLAPAGLLPAGIPTPFGFLDQDWSQGLVSLLDGITFGGTILDPLARTGANGQSNWTFPLAPGTATSFGAFQCLLVDPGAPGGFGLTAATDLTVVPGGPGFGIHVSSTNGRSGNTGTSTSPLPTITEGLARARATGTARVVVAAGTYAESPTFIDGISVVGGFDGNFQPNPTAMPIIEVGHVPARIRGVTRPTLLHRLRIVAAPGGTFVDPDSIALIAINCTSALTIEDCELVAATGGFGRPGLPGTIGAAGRDGEDGGDGVSGAVGRSQGGASPGTGSPVYPRGFGGGLGGSGGSGFLSAWSGAAGWGPAGGLFGVGGTDVVTPASGGNGARGQDATADGARGIDGSAGTAFTLSAQGFERGGSTSGLDGGNGSGGGGGGGGGGVDNLGGPLGMPPSDFGGGGGGGGEGGGGGLGGGGGENGGNSIALVLFNASPTLTSCLLEAADGGQGGVGANGAAGAPGGSGGSGGQGDGNAGNGGRGGDGSAGGSGGGGGGGRGGSSHGLVRNAASMVDLSTVTITIGTAAIGAPGGRHGDLSTTAPSGADGSASPVLVTP